MQGDAFYAAALDAAQAHAKWEDLLINLKGSVSEILAARREMESAIEAIWLQYDLMRRATENNATARTEQAT